MIMQRDDSLSEGVQLTEEVSSYHEESLAEAQKEYLRLRKMRQSARLRFSAVQFAATLKNGVESARENQEQHLRYSTMLGKVASWEPPTPDHAGLKTFMVEQLTESIEFDCSHTFGLDEIQAAMDGDPLMFHTKALESAKWSIGYHEEKLVEEHERIGGRNQWKQDLLGSVGPPPQVKA